MKPTTLYWIVSIVVLSYIFLVDLSKCISVPKKEPVYITAMIGEPALLPCQTVLNTPVVWMFQSNPSASVEEITFDGLFANGYAKHFLLDTALAGDHNLVIKSVNMTSAGMYTCDEDNGIGTRHTIHLNVTGSHLGQFVVSVGQTIRLPCHLTSRRVEDVLWYYKSLSARDPEDANGGWSLVNKSVNKFSVDDQNNVGRYDLVLQHAEMSDSGFYSCKSPSSNIIRNLSVTDSSGQTTGTEASTTDFRDIAARYNSPSAGIYIFVVIVIVVAVVSFSVNLLFIIRHYRPAWCPALCSGRQQKPKNGDATEPLLDDIGRTDDLNDLKKNVYSIIAKEITTISNKLHGDKYVFQLAKHPSLFAACIKKMAEPLKTNGKQVKAVIGLNGLDTRGELLASRIAGELNLPFLEMTETIASSDQDPGIVYKSELTGEKCVVSMSQDVIALGSEVAIVDNAVVTGATMKAATELATKQGLTVVQRVGLMKLPANVQQAAADHKTTKQTSNDVFDFILFDFQTPCHPPAE